MLTQRRDLYHYHLSRDAAQAGSLELKAFQSFFRDVLWTRILSTDASRQEMDIEAVCAPAGFCRRSGWTVEKLG